MAHRTRWHVQWPCLWHHSLPASQGALPASLPPPPGVNFLTEKQHECKTDAILKFLRSSLFKALGKADCVTFAMGNAQSHAIEAGTAPQIPQRILRAQRDPCPPETHALATFPVKRGLAGSGYSPSSASRSLVAVPSE